MFPPLVDFPTLESAGWLRGWEGTTYVRAYIRTCVRMYAGYREALSEKRSDRRGRRLVAGSGTHSLRLATYSCPEG